MNKKIISPVAIDLGAKNTGVYFAHYEADSSLDEIDKEGKVYQLDKNSYTLLMANRTAARHQRRGYDRRQMVKRLFKLIWEEHLGLEWDKKVQQTISFLLNRRGFSFLNGEYKAEILKQFPQEAYKFLPDEIKSAYEELKIEQNEDGRYDFDMALAEWAQEDRTGQKMKEKFDAINKEPKRIRERQVFIQRTKKLREYCEIRKDEKAIEQEKNPYLSRLSKWILEEWHKSGVEGLPPIPSDNKSVDMVEYLNAQKPAVASNILESLPPLMTKVTKKGKDLKNPLWNFNSEKFDQETVNFTQPNETEEKTIWLKNHLHHLAFALHKTSDELQSGGRHRSKYFEEVEEVLKKGLDTIRNKEPEELKKMHGYLRDFCEKLNEGQYQYNEKSLNAKSLTHLIGHLSNLELKPLRKYFNDEKHRRGDDWNEARFAKIYRRWIFKEWRVNPEKDYKKAPGGEYDYKKLRKEWEKKPGSVIDFWLANDPNWTIPPYQNNNNRRPPKCQSLILNTRYLTDNDKYPDWEDWLTRLVENVQDDYLGGYKEKLVELTSGKGKRYFSKLTGNPKTDSGRRTREELNARILQFIFDRTKDTDPLNLNEIYSHVKKIRQDKRDGKDTAETETKLKETLEKSKLPDDLKTDFDESSFLHLVCKYYKLRQRARDGRLFIHPKYRFVKGRGYENTGCFDDKNHLLTYCNHKPRQKRYQMLGDLANLLRVSPKELEKEVVNKFANGDTTDKKLFIWLSKIENLRANCERAAKEQKDRRGSLKLDIQRIFGFIDREKKNESPNNPEIKKILGKSKIKNAFKLYKFCDRAKNLSLEITACLYDDSRQKEWQNDLKRNPATAVYFLAQINNIVFKERGGNAKICAVCCLDNAGRMQIVPGVDDKKTTTKASRLPAISTRLIDGAVMRMARIVGGAIAKDKWEKIEAGLKEGNKICVPIIIESNRFEFEPNLKTLKNKKLTEEDKKYQDSNPFTDKEKRIKEANKDNKCPYTGKPIGEGEIDHIIPRSSNEYGTLNDEANLIWSSVNGNKKIKAERQNFPLQELTEEYKEAQFGSKNDEEITAWIIEQIGDGGIEEFKFGRYRSFRNLSPDEQEAFRHALFLVNHPLRKRVIDAINNRTRTLVNGTQRYFAQTIADKLYKEAKNIDKERNISFDFFGVEAWNTTRGNGVKDLRKELVENYRTDLKKFNKPDDNSHQEAYSHLLDAQIAFCMALYEHQKEGSFKLDLKKQRFGLWSRVDRETGEIKADAKGVVYDNADLFDKIEVKEDDDKFKEIDLKRRKPDETFSSHRSFTRDTFYADHYLPVLLQRKDDNSVAVKVGFDLQNSVIMETERAEGRKLLKTLVQLLPLCNEAQQLMGREYANLSDFFSGMEKTEYFAKQLQKNGYCYLTINKLKLHEDWINLYNTKAEKQFDKQMFVYEVLGYRTERIAINKPKDLVETLDNPKKFDLNVKEGKITLPARQQWQSLLDKWQKEEITGISFNEFLQEQDCFKPTQGHFHQKTRKHFSLPALTKEGKMMLQRKSWFGNYTFQIINDSDSRSPDNKPNTPVRLNDGSLGIRLAKWAQSNNIVEFSSEKYQDGENINPADWYRVDKKKFDFPDGIDQIWYRIDDATAPSIRVKLAKDGTDTDLQPSFMEENICKHGFRKRNAKKATAQSEAVPEKSPKDVCKKFFEQEIRPAKKGATIIYKACPYNKDIKEAFKTAEKEPYS